MTGDVPAGRVLLAVIRGGIGIAAGSLSGGLILQRAGPAALPWTTSLLSAAALATVATARRHAFPAGRAGAKTPHAAAPEPAILRCSDLTNPPPFSNA